MKCRPVSEERKLFMMSNNRCFRLIIMRYLIGSFLILLWCIPLTAGAAGINCSRALSVVEKAICNYPDLKNLDASISEKYDNLMKKLNPDEFSLLKTGQVFWIRERNDCQNVSYPSGKMESAVSSCLRNQLENREAFLRSAISDTALIAKNPNIYRIIDPWYFDKYKDSYQGSRVSISGDVVLYSCKDKKADKRAGYIVGSDKMKTKVPVFFKSMPENEHYFLCEKAPFSTWEGEVRTVNGKIVLYMDTVLGTKLP